MKCLLITNTRFIFAIVGILVFVSLVVIFLVHSTRDTNGENFDVKDCFDESRGCVYLHEKCQNLTYNGTRSWTYKGQGKIQLSCFTSGKYDRCKTRKQGALPTCWMHHRLVDCFYFCPDKFPWFSLENYCWKKPNQKLRKKSNTGTLKSCEALCEQTESCTAVNFNAQERSCQLIGGTASMGELDVCDSVSYATKDKSKLTNSCMNVKENCAYFSKDLCSHEIGYVGPAKNTTFDGIKCAAGDRCKIRANGYNLGPGCLYSFCFKQCQTPPEIPAGERPCIDETRGCARYKTKTCYGNYYRGRKNTTADGRECANWSTLTGSYRDWARIVGNHNDCRNPNGEYVGPWCYLKHYNPGASPAHPRRRACFRNC